MISKLCIFMNISTVNQCVYSLQIINAKLHKVIFLKFIIHYKVVTFF